MPERHDTAASLSLPHDAAARMRQLDQLHTGSSAFNFDDTAMPATASTNVGSSAPAGLASSGDSIS
jgi:hypothetical protein